ncbi:ATPase [Halopseudomonas sp.]|uniref:ATPase n=1 Tax=Halopseudomonas sp. TaxID=2901191 RepID=UPI0035687CA6
MKAETFADLIKWNSGVHDMLADRMQKAAELNGDERAKGLLTYVADHERMLADTVRKFGGRADEKALNTWLYEHVSEDLPPRDDRKLNFDDWDYERISEEVFDVHNQIIDLYFSMVERAAIPEAKDVMQELYDLHKHETLRLADQVNSGRSL